jgi:glycosyltransferase involved in cell wall biosynthesis
MKISVCLATYNGERFIKEQLRSILDQLGPNDELIVSDDHSKDGTVDFVRTLDDPRIFLIVESTNVGHVWNFERAISRASGDLLFLSDQDDIWHPQKIATVLREFEQHPKVQVIHHALSTIDEQGRTLQPLMNPHPEGEHGGIRHLFDQWVQCRVFGCGVAFRRELLAVLLPFPSFAYAHDHWIVAASGWKGGMLQINAPLVSYRQHLNNVTPKHGLSWHRRIYVRWLMLRMIVTAAVRIYRFR